MKDSPSLDQDVDLELGKIVELLADRVLRDPSFNLALGQEYVRMLLDDPNVQNDLFLMTIAYNAGPGNLAKWIDNVDYQDDPLLFIESIPSRETRHWSIA